MPVRAWCNALPRDPLPARASRQFDLEASRRGWTKESQVHLDRPVPSPHRLHGGDQDVRVRLCRHYLWPDARRQELHGCSNGASEWRRHNFCSGYVFSVSVHVSTNCENRSNYLSKSDCADNLWM
jgi:hypothetical protein